MLRKVLPPTLLAMAILGPLGCLIGVIEAGMAGAGAGFGFGLLAGALAGIVLLVRTLGSRTPESRTPELAPGSVERTWVREAAADTFVDATTTLAVASAVLAIAQVSIAFFVPLLCLVALAIDFTIRLTLARMRWAA